MWKVIRKFGLAHSDLPTMLWNVAFLLRVLTLNIDRRNKKRIPIFFYILTVVSTVCYFYVYLVSMIWFVFCRCKETGDLLAALIVFSLGVSSEIGIMKLFFMFLYIDKVQHIVSECLVRDALVVNSRFSQNLLRTLRDVKKRAMLFWIVVISNGIVYIIKPMLLPGRHIMEDLFIIYGLEPMYESPNYEVAFLLMSVGVCVTCYLPANITAFLIVITGYIEAQMLSWSEELIHLWEDAEKNYNKNTQTNRQAQNFVNAFSPAHRSETINEYIGIRLKVIIKGHAANINLLRQIEDMFRSAIAIEFFLLVVGLIAELLGGLENTYLEIPFALIQVAMDCLAGQRVMDASMAFERAVYNCKWENFDRNNMKIVMLILQNSQKTMTLSAGGITKLSFVSLMAVIKSVYSAYTTLRTTMNK